MRTHVLRRVLRLRAVRYLLLPVLALLTAAAINPPAAHAGTIIIEAVEETFCGIYVGVDAYDGAHIAVIAGDTTIYVVAGEPARCPSVVAGNLAAKAGFSGTANFDFDVEGACFSATEKSRTVVNVIDF